MSDAIDVSKYVGFFPKISIDARISCRERHLVFDDYARTKWNSLMDPQKNSAIAIKVLQRFLETLAPVLPEIEVIQIGFTGGTCPQHESDLAEIAIAVVLRGNEKREEDKTKLSNSKRIDLRPEKFDSQEQNEALERVISGIRFEIVNKFKEWEGNSSTRQDSLNRLLVKLGE